MSFQLVQGTRPTIDGVIVGVYGQVGVPATGVRLWITEPDQPMRDVSAAFGEPMRLNDSKAIVVDGIEVEDSGLRGAVFSARLVGVSSSEVPFTEGS